MTDREIIKALECCYEFQCDECPLDPHSIDPVICERRCKQESLNLINRQKAENEGLLHSVQSLSGHLSSARAEAIKEFAERLKEMSEHFWEEKENFVSEETIDNLVKEMVGEEQ